MKNDHGNTHTKAARLTLRETEMWINLSKMPDAYLTPYFRELLRRGQVWVMI